MNDPPPSPELCGSTRPSTACTATAASTAEPPAFSTFSPASTAMGLAAATIAVEACAFEAAGLRPGASAAAAVLIVRATNATGTRRLNEVTLAGLRTAMGGHLYGAAAWTTNLQACDVALHGKNASARPTRRP
jgi:hypothetical protein